MCADSDSDGLCDDGITYSTIQAAIAAASPGDTVHVLSGTYVEQLNIAKSLTLVGAGPCTTVRSPAELSSCFTAEDGFYPVICVHDANDVTIRDLVVDGASNGSENYRFVGVAYHNAGGRVENVEITGVHDTPWGNTQHGDGLYAYTSDGATRTLTVTNCSIHNFQKNGIVLRGAGLTANVGGNLVTGYGPTDVVVQNGIVVWGATGTVGPKNDISNISYPPEEYAASGILILSSNADVVDNDISDSEAGIYLWEGSGNISDNTVSASAADVGTEPFWGIIVHDPPNAPPSLSDRGGLESGLSAAGASGMDAAAVNVTGNYVAGGGASAVSIGLEADAGYGADDLDLRAAGNTITGWGYGVVLNQCVADDCSGTTFTSTAVNQNTVAGNTAYGMYVAGFTSSADAVDNWWGHDSGPYHASDNPDGQGNEVSDHVNWEPWLRRTYLPISARDFSPGPPMPDLRVTSLIVEPSSPAVGEPITVTIEVENVGTVAADPFWVDLYDNPAVPPTEANQIWNYLCSGALEDCYGIAWYVEDGLDPGKSVSLTSAEGYEDLQSHWLGYFARRGRHDLYSFADSWNYNLWYGAILERSEGEDNQYGPTTACVQPGTVGEALGAQERVGPIPFRPNRP
jgi:parallel beta-helix repeat protein